MYQVENGEGDISVVMYQVWIGEVDMSVMYQVENGEGVLCLQDDCPMIHPPSCSSSFPAAC